MSKPLVGILVGGALGLIDGISALLYPNTESMIVGIVIGSTLKGVIAGVLIGWFAKKVNSLPLGILFGLAVGAALAYAVAAMPSPDGKHYYWQIILPGSVLGIIVGYATQRYGERGRTGRTLPANP